MEKLRRFDKNEMFYYSRIDSGKELAIDSGNSGAKNFFITKEISYSFYNIPEVT